MARPAVLVLGHPAVCAVAGFRAVVVVAVVRHDLPVVFEVAGADDSTCREAYFRRIADDVPFDWQVKSSSAVNPVSEIVSVLADNQSAIDGVIMIVKEPGHAGICFSTATRT